MTWGLSCQWLSHMSGIPNSIFQISSSSSLRILSWPRNWNSPAHIIHLHFDSCRFMFWCSGEKEKIHCFSFLRDLCVKFPKPSSNNLVKIKRLHCWDYSGDELKEVSKCLEMFGWQLFAFTGGDQSAGDRHRNDAADQWEDQQHGAEASHGPQPSHQPSLHAAEWDRGPSCHGRFYQLWEGNQRLLILSWTPDIFWNFSSQTQIKMSRKCQREPMWKYSRKI